MGKYALDLTKIVIEWLDWYITNPICISPFWYEGGPFHFCTERFL